MTFTGLIVGGNLAIRAVSDVQGQVDRAGLRGMRRTVAGGATIVRGKASGRPGPRVITGDYRRTINGQVVEVSRGLITGQIGTNAVQARRLEFGFFGPDSLGREFTQQPRPHFAPSLGDVATLATSQIGEAITLEVAA